MCRCARRRPRNLVIGLRCVVRGPVVGWHADEDELDVTFNYFWCVTCGDCGHIYGAHDVESAAWAHCGLLVGPFSIPGINPQAPWRTR